MMMILSLIRSPFMVSAITTMEHTGAKCFNI